MVKRSLGCVLVLGAVLATGLTGCGGQSAARPAELRLLAAHASSPLFAIFPIHPGRQRCAIPFQGAVIHGWCETELRGVEPAGNSLTGPYPATQRVRYEEMWKADTRCLSLEWCDGGVPVSRPLRASWDVSVTLGPHPQADTIGAPSGDYPDPIAPQGYVHASRTSQLRYLHAAHASDPVFAIFPVLPGRRACAIPSEHGVIRGLCTTHLYGPARVAAASTLSQFCCTTRLIVEYREQWKPDKECLGPDWCKAAVPVNRRLRTTWAVVMTPGAQPRVEASHSPGGDDGPNIAPQAYTQARALHGRFFQGLDGDPKVYCEFDSAATGGPTLSCDGASRPHGDLPPGHRVLTIAPTGKARIVSAPRIPVRGPALQGLEVWTRPGFTCQFRGQMVCSNRSGHGFIVDWRTVRRF